MSSFYWDKMFINKLSSPNDFIISYERPAFFVDNKLKLTIKSLYDNNIELSILKDLEKFYAEHNRLNSGNIVLVTKDILKKYIDLNAELVMVFNKNKILGSMLSLSIPVRINMNINIDDIVPKSDKYQKIIPYNPDGKNMIFGCTTFLTNHTKYRGKGLGMMLIQKSLQIAYEEGILCAYFLNTTKRSTNAIPIRSWYYPLNLPIMDKYNIYYHKRYKQYYNFKLPPNIEITRVSDIEGSLNIYLDLVKDKTFYLNPDMNFWSSWVQLFDTYIVKSDGNVVGIFTIKYLDNHIPSISQNIKGGQILLCVGKQPETIKSLIHICREDQRDIVYLQQYGDLTDKILQDLLAINTKKYDYMNFYNTSIQLKSTDIYIPLV